jgi:hypothetical protein
MRLTSTVIIIRHERPTLSRCGRRPGERQQTMMGSVSESRFEGAREELLAKLSADMEAVMKTYDKGK